MSLEEFNSKYVYKTDKQKFGFPEVWEIPELEQDGHYYGDCESYALFLKNKIEKFEEWDLYYCKLNGNGHCVLSNGAMIIDCNSRQTLLRDKFIERYNITDLKRYNYFTIFSKLLFSGIYLKVKKWVS